MISWRLRKSVYPEDLNWFILEKDGVQIWLTPDELKTLGKIFTDAV